MNCQNSSYLLLVRDTILITITTNWYQSFGYLSTYYTCLIIPQRHNAWWNTRAILLISFCSLEPLFPHQLLHLEVMTSAARYTSNNGGQKHRNIEDLQLTEQSSVFLLRSLPPNHGNLPFNPVTLWMILTRMVLR